ncbi:MAG: radical SAM protein [Candidatus Methanofastidiosia archaeon]|jgi:uncharacterized protein
MKSSVFNVFVPAKKGYALYNTLHQSVLFCDEELKSALQTNVNTIAPEYVPTLKQHGIVVENTKDEYNMYTYRYNSTMCNTKEIQFVAVTTYKCNLQCPYCYEGKGEVYSQDMDMKTAEKIITSMQTQISQKKSRYVTLILFGGEPLLNLDVGLHIVNTMKEWCTAHEKLLRTFVTTNGTLLPKKVSQLRDVINGIQLTFDGSKKYHNTTRIYKNGKGTYNDVITAMETALDYGMKVSLRIQINKENYADIHTLFDDIAPYIKKNVNINIAPLSRYSSMCTNYSSHFLEKEEKETVLPTMLKYTQNIKPVPHYVPCVAYTNNIIFDGSGNVYTCITTVGEDTKSGYVTDTGIQWEPELYQFMGRNPLKIPECKTCAFLPLCGGGCPRTAYLTHGDYNNQVCGGSKSVYQAVVTEYVKRKYPDRF